MAKRMFALQKPDPVKRNRSELDCVWAPNIGEDVNTRVPAGVLLPVSSSHGPARQAQLPDQGDAAVWGRSRPRRGHGNSLIFFFSFFHWPIHVALLQLNVLHWELRAHAASTALVSNRIVGFCRVLTGRSERTFKSAVRKLSQRKIFGSYFKRHGYFPRPDVCVCSYRDI